MSVAPNPSQGESRIAFSAAVLATDGTIRVHDASGRLVRASRVPEARPLRC